VAVLAWLSTPVSGAGFDVQGHRGCRGLLPENSIPAFRRAIELGVTTLELDLQATSDRVLVVHHDPAPNPKICRGPGGEAVGGAPFVERSWEEVSRLDCGSRRAPGFPLQQTVPGAGIPRLDDVLALARDAPYGVRVSVEIKLQDPARALAPAELAGLVVDAIRRHDLLDRAVVQSFDPEALVEVRRLAESLPRALLVRRASGHERWLDDGTATILSPKFGKLTRERVAELRRRNVPVVPWTVNEPEDIRRLIDWEVDGMISDYPDRVLEALEEH
jgi:glycerophosphoryl diester phosphodiesterase